jgi:hypothetical protein
MTMARDLFLAFLKDPGPETFRAVRTAVVEGPEFNPYGDDLGELDALAAREAFEEIRPRFQEALPTLLLSPRAHLLMAWAAHKRGQTDEEEMERAICSACVHGILSTGDGSLEKPFLVTTTSDEYTVLELRGLTSSTQTLMHEGDRHLDRQQCSDGTVLYFDVTDLFAVLGRRLGLG